MSKVLRVFLLAVAFSLPLALVASEPDRGRDTLHQVSTLTALLAGDYDH